MFPLIVLINMHYTIIDVETTGRSNRVTEISIFRFDGSKVLEEFTSLVNPEDYIPRHITALTGIDNDMVAAAPTFDEIAEKVVELTEDAVFVAHNVNFDYNVIGGEFKRIGIPFSRKKLCTVRLSRKLLPGHRSYGLGKLCRDLEIPIVGRHRARGDAEATTTLFKMLLAQEEAEKVFATFLKRGSQEATLPSHLPRTDFEALPNAPGVYFFRNKKGKIIYVGKAKDLKKRVLSHFYDKKQKELDLCRETANIDFELSGSELVALLMEDAAIKHHYPVYNKVAKRAPKSYAIFSYTDRAGIVHLAFNDVKASPNPLLVLYSITQCRTYLQHICSHFELCPKFCHLQENVPSCSHYAIEFCKGVCRSEEAPSSYNERVALAIEHILESNQNLILKEKGRDAEEDAFIMVRNGIYLGYGFVDRSTDLSHIAVLENYLVPQKNSVDVWRILRKKLVV